MRRPGSHRPGSHRLGKKRLELDRVLKLLLKCLTSRKPISLIAISPQTDPITEIFVMEQWVTRDSKKLLLLLSKYSICQHVLPFLILVRRPHVAGVSGGSCPQQRHAVLYHQQQQTPQLAWLQLR